MVQKILTALDGSKASESILPYLEKLLASQDANVSLVRVTSGGSEAKKRTALAYLERVATALRARGAVVDLHVLGGKPAPVIVDMAVRGGYSLIVMCTRGKSGLKRMILGSTAEEVMRRSPLPVLIVHPLAASGDSVKFKRILVPLDGSHRSGSILPHVAPIAKATGARVHFTTIVEPRSREDLPAEVAARNLFREQKRLFKQGIQTEISIRYGDPVAEILALGNVQDADMIALSTHGRTGLERARYGSVAESILRKGRLPLLLLRTAGKFVSDPIHASQIRQERQKEREELETSGANSR